MTKHMSSELANRHLQTLNMKLSDGRAEAAPTLDSLVQAWYSDSDGNVIGSREVSDGCTLHEPLRCA